MVNKSMNFWTYRNMQKRPQAPKPIFSGLGSEKSEYQIQFLISFEKHLKFAHGISVQNGSYAFPSELVRFRKEAKAIWEKIQIHCKNAVII